MEQVLGAGRRVNLSRLRSSPAWSSCWTRSTGKETLPSLESIFWQCGAGDMGRRLTISNAARKWPWRADFPSGTAWTTQIRLLWRSSHGLMARALSRPTRTLGPGAASVLAVQRATGDVGGRLRRRGPHSRPIGSIRRLQDGQKGAP